MGAGTLLSTYSIGDANLNAVMNSLDGTRIGYQSVTLTTMSSVALPSIAAGSVIEVGGALYKFYSNSTLAGSPGDGQCYIYLIPSSGSTTVSATLSSVAPTWDDSKQGWYGIGASAGYRYIDFLVYKSSGYRKAKIGKEYSAHYYSNSTTAPSYTAKLSFVSLNDPFSVWQSSAPTELVLPFTGCYHTKAGVNYLVTSAGRNYGQIECGAGTYTHDIIFEASTFYFGGKSAFDNYSTAGQYMSISLQPRGASTSVSAGATALSNFIQYTLVPSFSS